MGKTALRSGLETAGFRRRLSSGAARGRLRSLARLYSVAMAGPIRPMTAPAPILKVALFGTPSRFTTQALQQLARPGFNVTVILAQPELSIGNRLMRFAGLH